MYVSFVFIAFCVWLPDLPCNTGLQPSLDEYERALYGSLSGDLPSVLSVSQSWEEHLWAYVNAKFEAQVDAQLDARGGWWSQEADTQFGTDECGAVKVSDPSVIGKDVSSLDLVTIFSRLSNTERHGVQ